MSKTMRAVKMEDTSSAYSSSKESIHEHLSPNIFDELPPLKPQSDSTCSCGKSNSLLTQKYHSNGAQGTEQRPRKKSSSRHSQGSCTMQKNSLAQINEQLVAQNKYLKEQNQNLLDELQISRRFYQGSLADLTSQLAIAENRIKYLKEVVSMYEEVVNKNKESASNKNETLSTLNDVTSPVVGIKKEQRTQSLLNVQLAGHAKPKTASSVRSSAGSSTSEISGSRSRLGSRQRGNFAKMKEHLLEKNQKMKTDIEQLKIRSDLPRSSLVPVLTPRASSLTPRASSLTPRASSVPVFVQHDGIPGQTSPTKGYADNVVAS